VNARSPRVEPRCFLHVPKSGGTSVHVALEQALPSGTMSPKRGCLWPLGELSDVDAFHPDVHKLMAVNEAEVAALSNSAVISGHFPLPVLLWLTSASAVATVLREPRARVLSHYAWWRLLSQDDRNTWRDPRPDHALRPLDEFLAEPQVAQATDNVVCRMLLGGDPTIPELGFIAPEDVDDLAVRAIAALDGLGFVGILELGDLNWAGLSRFFEVPLTPLRLNITTADGLSPDPPGAKLEITQRTFDLLDVRTAVDAILYRHALACEGYPAEGAERLIAAAFADELVRLGNVAGPHPSELRERVRRKDAELHDHAERLRLRAEELWRTAARLDETRQQLAGAEDQLRWHRIWLDGIQGSASWRLTAPARAAKRILRRT
jgi:hypothetical protein